MFHPIEERIQHRVRVAHHPDWEHGGFEHNHTLFDELTRAVFVVRPGGGLAEGRRIDTPATLLDIAPTLYDLLGFVDAPQTDGRSLVPLVAEPAAQWPDRPVPIGYLQYAHERWGVVWNGRKYLLHTGTGREELYDLAPDPRETSDLSAAVDLGPYREQLSVAHGIPVGPGWRIDLDLDPADGPVTIELPAPAIQADVLDPESVVEHRANIEWGELPRRLPMEVGRVEPSADRRTLVFTPGPLPDGILYVLFESAQDPALARVSRGGQPLVFGPETMRIEAGGLS